MFSKAQLIEKGKHYFDDKNVNVMLATPDGNFFFEHSKNYADSHAKTKKIEVITILRTDLAAKAEATKETDVELAELRKEAKKLKIKGFAIMKADKLKEKIAEATK